MKKIFFLLLPFVVILSSCEKKDDGPNPDDIVDIPDIEFLYALINEGVDTNGDSLISYGEAEAVDTLICGFGTSSCGDIGAPCDNVGGINPTYGDIISLEGINAFKNLQYLDCSFNVLASLDVSNNIVLAGLSCGANELDNLDVSNNVLLTSLDVSNNLACHDCATNQLTSLDVSNNTALTHLYCDHNNLTSLDISNNTSLTYLSCYGNGITNLDVSNNTALTHLYCGYNNLTNLDVSNNTALTHLNCGGNNLSSWIFQIT